MNKMKLSEKQTSEFDFQMKLWKMNKIWYCDVVKKIPHSTPKEFSWQNLKLARKTLLYAIVSSSHFLTWSELFNIGTDIDVVDDSGL